MKTMTNYLTCLLICLTFAQVAMMEAFSDIDEHTVGIWMLDEGKGKQVKDLTDNHNDGEIQGDVKWVKGNFGSALEFNGSGSVIVPNSKSLNIDKQITIEAWITFSDAGKGQDMVIARIEPAYSLQKFNNDQIEGWVSIGGWKGVRDLPGAKTLEPNEWYHVAFTYDGKTLITYVNGEPDRENKISGNIDVVNAPFTIGSYKGEAYFWRGNIDEVRVSNIARSQDDIKAVMAGFESYLGVAPVGKLANTWAQIKENK
ncbi:LamG domain-containing protein [Candidatus Poribacteria bacterium]|nr:LamG domain-containing protein [Candidatus Poribacteria bacterium]